MDLLGKYQNRKDLDIYVMQRTESSHSIWKWNVQPLQVMISCLQPTLDDHMSRAE